ncbi:MAG: prenyltransferase [Anaerolineales bacterium]|nr:prenyltransferase [Anaerolineales bacterium]MCL4258391.1 prenyltransferase [Anaerolineales bacterium]
MATRAAARKAAKNHPIPLVKRWQTVLNGCNIPQLELADGLTRWLVISRACVFSMSFTSGMLGLLIAAEQVGIGNVNWLLGILAVIGVVAAHASNNLLNDYFDVRQGVDTEDYPRAQYSTHPILGGLTTPKGLLLAAGLLNLVDLAIMLYLFSQRGILIVAFAVAGLLLSLLYTSVLKRAGLGELTALIVWGPLMIGGTAFAASGVISPAIWVLSLPYGLIVASVLIGKHIDKIKPDKKVGVNSVPVLLGEKRSLQLNKVTFIIFYILILAMVFLKYTGPWVLLTFLAIPRLRQTWKAYSEPKPAKAPAGWTVWPLWYVSWAMLFNRKAGEFFTLGLLLNLATPYVVGLFS